MIKKITIPDIGGAEDVDVIEIMVAPGEKISKDQSLITLESDKASMDIPAPVAGVVSSVEIQLGDKVKEGDLIMTMEVAETNQTESSTTTTTTTVNAEVREVVVPDIGNATDVDVIEVMVAAGDQVNLDDSLITLESDKASMDIPSPYAGIVKEVKLNVGDKVSQGSLILLMEAQPATPSSNTPTATTASQASQPSQAATAEVLTPTTQTPTTTTTPTSIYASPSVRRLARELGVDLRQVMATGKKGRIQKSDVQAYVKRALAGAGSASGMGLAVAPMPTIDFSQFGAIETRALNKIKKLTGQNLHRSWVTIPHVTQFDEVDITELERFRKANKHKAEAQDAKLTPLVFLMKAAVACLQALPLFNSSLDPSGEQLIMKQYFHIGVAVDTPDGLVVPVIRDVDQKGLLQLAAELATISEKARNKRLMPNDMQGACFTISSLGGIGGTAFTPIVNGPEVAILGVSKARTQPVYIGETFQPRLMLPLSLSYDHRVIDGADAARFTTLMGQYLSDIRNLLL
jgi:pyruvate dehydrogenase E2 component (dihydrolipoamide acetyltransferase)